MSPTRAERRADVERRILQIARAHLAQEGAAGLSLRAVTRELGMVSSAVYRYVADRDELLTLLVVDGYTDLADAVDAAVEAAAEQPWHERIVAGALAFRAWAVADPARYALLYGSPVPGYQAPGERTIGPGTRVQTTLTRLVAEGVAVGEVAEVPGHRGLDPRLEAPLAAAAAELGLPAGPAVMAAVVGLWSVVVGGTSLEVFGQYGPDGLGAPDALFEHQVRAGVDALRA